MPKPIENAPKSAPYDSPPSAVNSGVKPTIAVGSSDHPLRIQGALGVEFEEKKEEGEEGGEDER